MDNGQEITGVISQLTSKSGRPYLGCEIAPQTVSPYLPALFAQEPSDFTTLRENQMKRDRGEFHLTLISPPEFQKLIDSIPNSLLGEQVLIRLGGLGSAEVDAERTFFITAESDRLAEIRAYLGLDPRDFHITIGFDEEDVHGVIKDKTTLIRRGPR